MVALCCQRTLESGGSVDLPRTWHALVVRAPFHDGYQGLDFLIPVLLLLRSEAQLLRFCEPRSLRRLANSMLLVPRALMMLRLLVVWPFLFVSCVLHSPCWHLPLMPPCIGLCHC